MEFFNYCKSAYYKKVWYLLNSKFIGKLVKKGNKTYAWRLFFNLKYLLKKKIKKDINIILLIALLNSLQKVHLIKKRFGSAFKEIPITLSFDRQIKFALSSWLNDAGARINKINIQRLISIICSSYKYKGIIIKQKYQVYKMAIENRILLNFIKR